MPGWSGKALGGGTGERFPQMEMRGGGQLRQKE